MVRWIQTVEKENIWELEAKSTDTLPTEDAFGKRLGGGSSVFLIDTQEVRFFDYATATWLEG